MRSRAPPRWVGLQSQSVAFGRGLLPIGFRAFRFRPVDVTVSFLFRRGLVQLAELVERPGGQFTVV